MAPPRNGTGVETPMRQSCDRCHSQKLRCTRGGTNNTGACGRCLRKRVQCVYSFSLPKGRPSVYHLADKSTTAATGSGNGNAPPLDGPSTAPLTPVTTPASSRTGSVDIHADASTNSTADASAHSSMSDDSILSQLMVDTSTEMPTHQWPWLNDINWDDTQVNWSDSSLSQSTINWHTITDSSPTSDNTAYLSDFPALQDWACTEDDATHRATMPGKPGLPALAQTLPSLQRNCNSLGSSHSEEHSNFSSGRGNSGGGNTSDSGVVIGQLSELSMRLSRLLRLSYDLAATSESSYPSNDHNQAHQKPLIDNATFELVATWLVHGSANMNLPLPTHSQDSRPVPAPETKTTGSVLYHLFSASRQLLEVLCHLRISSGINTPNLSTPTPATISPVDSIDPSYFAMNSGSPTYSIDRNRHCNNVVRHLVISCHTMLLNTYVSVLKTLEHNANPSCHTGAAALGDMRLVSIVQLCSYLTERQHQAMGGYLATQSPPTGLQWQDLVTSTPNQAAQSFPDTTTGEEMMDMKTEVQQRLARLQQTLCF